MDDKAMTAKTIRAMKDCAKRHGWQYLRKHPRFSWHYFADDRGQEVQIWGGLEHLRYLTGETDAYGHEKRCEDGRA
jgi:hypothetical protein